MNERLGVGWGGVGGGGAWGNTPRGRVHIRIAIPRGNLPQFLPLPRHSQPSQARSVPASIVQSGSPFTVGASEEPIRLAVERKSEVWQRVVDLPLFPPLSCSFTYTLLYTHTFTDTLTRGRTRKRVAPGDGGLAERRMLAARGPDPSPGSIGPLSLPLTR